MKIGEPGEILEEIRLPAEVDALQRRFGPEGVTAIGRSDEDDDDN